MSYENCYIIWCGCLLILLPTNPISFFRTSYFTVYYKTTPSRRTRTAAAPWSPPRPPGRCSGSSRRRRPSSWPSPASRSRTPRRSAPGAPRASSSARSAWTSAPGRTARARSRPAPCPPSPPCGLWTGRGWTFSRKDGAALPALNSIMGAVNWIGRTLWGFGRNVICGLLMVWVKSAYADTCYKLGKSFTNWGVFTRNAKSYGDNFLMSLLISTFGPVMTTLSSYGI